MSRIPTLHPPRNKSFPGKLEYQNLKCPSGLCMREGRLKLMLGNDFLYFVQDLLAQFGIRSPFTGSQRQSLDNAYLENKYPTNDEKKFLASSLGISVKQVTIWFQNRRQKDKATLP